MDLYTTIDSPLGELLLRGDGKSLCGLHMQGGRTRLEVDPSWQRADQRFCDVSSQLAEYFDGTRTEFDVPLSLRGPDFERRVWHELCRIPYGQTRSYGEIAAAVGDPSAARAVGTANARNPIAIIVPCHRVIGADGSLTGFGGGLERKRTLLDLEALTLV
jgi:methylated-DNA-[protein]-cysteine S-methyltransferase